MFKNKLFLVIAVVLFSTIVKAQSLTINNTKFDIPGFSYSIGGSVSIPVNQNGCFLKTNVFKWELWDATGTTGLNANGLPATGANIYGGTVKIGRAHV